MDKLLKEIKEHYIEQPNVKRGKFYIEALTLEKIIKDWQTNSIPIEPPVGVLSRTLSESAYRKIGEFQTIGELRKLLEPFVDEMPLGFINQPSQDLYLSIDLQFGSRLGFQ